MARFGYKDIQVYLKQKYLYVNCGMVAYMHGSNYETVFPINTGLKVINIEELYTSGGNSAGETGAFVTFEVNLLDTSFNTYQTNFLLLGVEDITSTVLSIISTLLNNSLPQIIQNSVDTLAEIKKLTEIVTDYTFLTTLGGSGGTYEHQIYLPNDTTKKYIANVFSEFTPQREYVEVRIRNNSIDKKALINGCGIICHSISKSGFFDNFNTVVNINNVLVNSNGGFFELGKYGLTQDATFTQKFYITLNLQIIYL